MSRIDLTSLTTMAGTANAVLADVQKVYDNEVNQRDILKRYEHELAELVKDDDMLDYYAIPVKESIAFFSRVSYERNAVVFEEVKKIIDSALRATFIDENISLYLNEKTVRNKTSLEIHTMENGKKRDIKVGNGNAVRQLIDLLFRVVCITIYSKSRNVNRLIVGDEILSGINYLIAPAVTQILTEMHQKNGFDFILVEQKDALWECGIPNLNVMYLKKEDGELKIAKQFVTKSGEGMYVDRLNAGTIVAEEHRSEDESFLSFDKETGELTVYGEPVELPI